jgi:hypothetical protein
MKEIPEFKKPEENEAENLEVKVREEIKGIIEKDFTLKHEPRSQEEIQATWDEKKRKESQKFKPENLEQGGLF